MKKEMLNIKENVGAGLVPAQRGITLIALIITIIIMLILAGVVLSLTLGENGILKTAKYATQRNSEESAKEKLELALADLTSHKYTNEDYDENEYINNYLKNKDMTVEGNIVTVDNWNFEIDRSVPCIKSNLGESEVKLTKEVKEYLGKNDNDKYMVAVLIKIESNFKIESIEFENTDGTTLTVKAEKEILAKDMQIELDREYKITVKMANGKTVNRTIIEKSIENIRTVEELVAFRDKVNIGLTYEGKTINLVNDIDLSSVCGENVNGETISWEPIGNYDIDDTHIFKGIFDGNNKIVNNLYINTDRYYQGIFGANAGEIKSLTINGEIVSNGYYIGGIVGYNGGEIVNSKNNAHIAGENHVGGIAGLNDYSIEKCCNTGEIYASNGNVGGIVGVGSNYIGMCYNTGNVYADNMTAGGIIGYKCQGQTYNCYNKGDIYSINSNTGGINGAAGASWSSTIYTYNCYNLGSVIGNKGVGEITGTANANYGSSQDINCYTTDATAELLNSGEYGNVEWVDDVKIKDKETGEEKWKYNDGYPILKWQIENK